ncbi:MAG: hypothetical protein JXA57_10790 [Armatimonadetes bacterium]|nr:hypothetical protein [Armatimonadota bacterium]
MHHGDTLTIRDFREGDQQELSALFNEYLASYAGPTKCRPAGWRRQFAHGGWNGPSLTDDPGSCRIAMVDGAILGYAVTDYQPFGMRNAAVVQELCLAQTADAETVTKALLEDAENRARERGRHVLAVQLSPDDAQVTTATARLGFDGPGDDGGVFMAVVVDLRQALEELTPALSEGLADSVARNWRGTVSLRSNEQAATLEVENGHVSVNADTAPADIETTVDPEWLPLLLLGRESVGELYVQHAITVKARDREYALQVLEALFPRRPVFLPRVQWW